MRVLYCQGAKPTFLWTYTVPRAQEDATNQKEHRSTQASRRQKQGKNWAGAGRSKGGALGPWADGPSWTGQRGDGGQQHQWKHKLLILYTPTRDFGVGVTYRLSTTPPAGDCSGSSRWEASESHLTGLCRGHGPLTPAWSCRVTFFSPCHRAWIAFAPGINGLGAPRVQGSYTYTAAAGAPPALQGPANHTSL